MAPFPAAADLAAADLAAAFESTTPFAANPMFHECLYDEYTFWTLGVVGNGINVVGLLGNLLTFFVLVRMQMTQKTSILIYIIAITFSDSVILFFSSIVIYSLR